MGEQKTYRVYLWDVRESKRIGHQDVQAQSSAKAAHQVYNSTPSEVSICGVEQISQQQPTPTPPPLTLENER